MTRYLAYWGEFLSLDNAVYRVEIYTADSVSEPIEVEFDADQTAVIEWTDVSKFDPVQGSSLSLNLISGSDREYLRLYSTDPLANQVRVFRDGELMWTGFVDPELYTEPYVDRDGYTTNITASDFAVLDRQDWSLRGMRSIEEILTACMTAIELPWDWAAVGTEGMFKACINCDNFYDEDDEPMTMREVLESVLQPFAVRIVQRNGFARMFDITTIHDRPCRPVEWESTDAELGYDKTYNKVEVHLSTYEDEDVASLDPDDIFIDCEPEMSLIYRYDTPKSDQNTLENPNGFELKIGEDPDASVKVYNGAKHFAIEPIFNGESKAGVLFDCLGPAIANKEKMVLRPDTKYDRWRWPWVTIIASESFDSSYQYGMTACHKIFDGPQLFCGRSGANADGRPAPTQEQIRITLELLFDPRYNPWEGNFKEMRKYSQLAYIPVKITLVSEEGQILAWYDNRSAVTADRLTMSASKWVYPSVDKSEPEWGDAWLAWYSWDNRKEDTGLGCFTKNKQAIGKYTGAVPKLWELRGDGEFIDLPETPGWIRVEVGSGIMIESYPDSGHPNPPVIEKVANSRWMAYGDMAIEIVDMSQKDQSKHDVVDSAWIDEKASEKYEITTTVGTPGRLAGAGARCCLYNRSGGVYSEILAFTREGVTDRLERLLIGTVYSQCRERRIVLTGTAKFCPAELTYKEAASEPATARYLMLSETADLRLGESEIKIVNIGKDDYEAVEINTSTDGN